MSVKLSPITHGKRGGECQKRTQPRRGGVSRLWRARLLNQFFQPGEDLNSSLHPLFEFGNHKTVLPLVRLISPLDSPLGIIYGIICIGLALDRSSINQDRNTKFTNCRICKFVNFHRVEIYASLSFPRPLISTAAQITRPQKAKTTKMPITARVFIIAPTA